MVVVDHLFRAYEYLVVEKVRNLHSKFRQRSHNTIDDQTNEHNIHHQETLLMQYLRKSFSVFQYLYRKSP